MTMRDAWGPRWHVHEPPLMLDAVGEPLPELAMAVVEVRRREGIGMALVEAIAQKSAQRFDALTLNVHLLNPAVGLYIRTGFRVAELAAVGWSGDEPRAPT